MDARFLYQSTQVLEPTPNSVRWDEVNNVKYRFQALRFRNDDLAELVWKFPSLRTRKSAIQPDDEYVINNSNDENKYDGLFKQIKITHMRQNEDYSSDYHSDDESSTKSLSINKNLNILENDIENISEDNDIENISENNEIENISEKIDIENICTSSELEGNNTINSNNANNKEYSKEELSRKDKNELLTIIDQLQSQLTLPQNTSTDIEETKATRKKVIDMIQLFER